MKQKTATAVTKEMATRENGELFSSEYIKERLRSLSEEKYQRFAASLIPTIDNVLGVRIPLLRQLARQIAKEDWRQYLQTADQQFFEEVMLQGLVIAYIKVDEKERMSLIREFVPKIDNWSVCDSFCSSLKFTASHHAYVWEYLQSYVASKREYEVRFAVVMMLNYYVTNEYIDRVLTIFRHIDHQGYYVKMAVAWALSACYVQFPEKTIACLQMNTFDIFTHNKAIQKITESLRIDAGTKEQVKRMKRSPK